VAFDVPAESYDRFMGRYSAPLSPLFADYAGVDEGGTALDVGCGPGALTSELVRRLGAGRVAAVDPSASFVEAARARHPGVDVRQAPAEELPYPDDAFDAVLAQLVVHFMADPPAGAAEMRRVARDGGVVALCVWDLAGDRSPLAPFWDSVREVVPGTSGESLRPGARAGEAAELLRGAGLRDVEEGELAVEVDHPSFEEWWEPFTYGVGPAGGHLRQLGDEDAAAVRERARARLGDGPFVLRAVAWVARGTA
jgi:SAM-dependent methyltransferase